MGLFCLFLAGFTKQLSVFTAAAVFGYLFLLNPKRSHSFSLGLFGIAFGLVFLLINYATDGYWWTNIISANVNAYLIPQLIGLTRTWLKIHPLYILCALGWWGMRFMSGAFQSTVYGLFSPWAPD